MYSKIIKILLGFMGVIVFAISFFISFFLIIAHASALENFDSYSTGNIDDKSANWIYDSGGHLEVSNSEYSSSPNSLLHNTSYNNGGTLYNPIGIDAIESLSFKFKFNDSSATKIQLYGHNSSTYDTSIYTEDLFYLYIRKGSYNRFYYDSTGSNYETVGATINDTNWHTIDIYGSETVGLHKICVDEVCSSWRQSDKSEAWDSLGFNDNYHNMSYNHSYDDFSFAGFVPPFSIASPVNDEEVINDSWITVSGTCETNGNNRIGLTNSCLGFSEINYDIDCVAGSFASQFYKAENSNWIIAREIDSTSLDCVEYDALVDMVVVDGINIIEGYPDEWNFDYGYYDDFDIRINSPIFNTALTLPFGATSTDMYFGFIYPTPLSSNLVFNIKQYDSNGAILDTSYHNINLTSVSDTNDYEVNIIASSTAGLHYVVQLIDTGVLKRQYPFGIYVSDYEVIINPDNYIFPRLVEELKTKVIFNYFFAFYDNFQTLFSASSTASSTALDVTFKSVSADGEYDLDIPIFTASNSIIQSLTQGLRPYIVAFLWVGFAVYLFNRISSKKEEQ